MKETKFSDYELISYKNTCLTKNKEFLYAYEVSKNPEEDVYDNVNRIKDILEWRNSIKIQENILKEIDSIKLTLKSKFIICGGEILVQDISKDRFLYIVLNTNEHNYRNYLCAIPENPEKFVNISLCEKIRFIVNGRSGWAKWEIIDENTAVYKNTHWYENAYNTKDLQAYLDVITNKSLKIESFDVSLDKKNSYSSDKRYDYQIKVSLVEKGYLRISKKEIMEKYLYDFIHKVSKDVYFIKYKTDRDNPAIVFFELKDNVIIDVVGDSSLVKYKGYRLVE